MIIVCFGLRLLTSFSSKNGDTIKDATCPTLRLLIEQGHVIYFTWKFGYEPTTIESKDIFSDLYEEELKNNLETNCDTELSNEPEVGYMRTIMFNLF